MPRRAMDTLVEGQEFPLKHPGWNGRRSMCRTPTFRICFALTATPALTTDRASFRGGIPEDL